MKRSIEISYGIAELDTFTYHINYSVKQGFPVLKKAVTTHVKNTLFFHAFDITNLLQTRSCLSRHSVRLMNERQSLHHSRSKVVSDYGC